MINKINSLGFIAAVASAAAFSTLSFFTRNLYAQGFSVANVLFLRFSMAAIILWLVIAACRKRMPSCSKVGASLLLGIFGYTGQAALFFIAIANLKSGLASILLYLYPFVVFLLVAVMQRRPPKLFESCILVAAFVGSSLSIDPSDPGLNVVGIAAGVGAALWYGAYLVIGERVAAKMDPLVTSAFVFTGSAASIGCFGLVSGDFVMPSTLFAWVSVGGLAIVATVIPVVALFRSMQLIGSRNASIVSTLEPAFTVALGLVLLNESLGQIQLIGMVTVLVAIVMLQTICQTRRCDKNSSSLSSTQHSLMQPEISR